MAKELVGKKSRMARTTRTATTVWIGPIGREAAS
jgi:hypothetical protein